MPGTSDAPTIRKTLRARLGVEAVAAFLVTLSAFGWFLSRLSPDIAFGPWQGPFLSPHPLHPLPLLSQFLAQATTQSTLADAAWQLNLLTAAFGALACGVVAAAATRAGRGLAGPIEAGAGGMIAAAFFASTPLLTYAASGTTPTTLSVFLGLAALLALVLWLEEDASFAYAVAAAVFAGLAAANHPSMGLLFFILAGATLLLPRGNHSVLGVFTLGAVFLSLACLPLEYSLLRGESVRQFLSHALLTPYPNPVDGVPDFGFGENLMTVLTPLVLVLALAGLLGLFRPGLRRYTTVAAVVFLVMGPFLPALVNHDSGPEVLYDPDAPRLIAVAMVCIVAGLGALAGVRIISSSQQARPRRLALLLGITGLVLVLHVQSAPDRHQTAARDLAREILQSCPTGALLVSGDPNLTSIVMASQYAHGLRRDVDVLPTEFLTRPRYRTELHDRFPSRLKLSSEFPSDEAVSRWATERPLVFDRLLKDGGDLPESPEALDLALWDLVMDNPNRWPICFIAAPSGWLMARAQLSGPVICYPRRVDLPAQGFLDLMKRIYVDDAHRRDPGIAQALGAILIPSAELLGRQHSAEDAGQLVELAEQLGVDRAQVRLALSRTAARQGNRDEATRYASEYLAATDATSSEQFALTTALDSDLRCAVLRSQFQQVVDLARDGKPDNILREEISKQLWLEDDIGALAEGYRALVQVNPDDIGAIYQYSATLTQLGELPEAQSLLAKAALANPSAIGQRLEAEKARFTLLRIYHRMHSSTAAE